MIGHRTGILLNDFLARACTVPSMRQFLSFYTIFLSITLCWRHGAFVNTGRVSYRDYGALRQASTLRKTHGKDIILSLIFSDLLNKAFLFSLYIDHCDFFPHVTDYARWKKYFTHW